MKPYREFRPSAMDGHIELEDEQENWLVAPVAINRGSDILSESNWNVVTDDIRTTDSENMVIHRFGHWACGWFEICLVRPDSKAAKCAEEWESALDNYPVASDDDFSTRQHNAICEWWKNASIPERIRILKQCEANIMAARRDSLPDYDKVWTYMCENLD